MRCPKCGHKFKNPVTVAGGKASKRTITPKQQERMQYMRQWVKRRNNNG